MHSKTLARPLISSLLLALPLTVGCVAEWHSGEDPFSDDTSAACDGHDGTDAGTNDNNNNNNGNDDCPSAEGTIYVDTNTAVCDQIGFTCPANYTAFNEVGCGCGCEPMEAEPPVCPEDDGDGITRLSRDLKVCNSITFTCPENSDPFNGACGCGCITQTSTTPSCPDPDAMNVHYLGDSGSAVCEMIPFTCPAGCVQFNDDCGCGCIEP